MYNTRPTTRERPGREILLHTLASETGPQTHRVWESKIPERMKKIPETKARMVRWGRMWPMLLRTNPMNMKKRLTRGKGVEERIISGTETSRFKQEQNEIFMSGHSNHTKPWWHVNGYSLSTLTVDSEVIWKLAGTTYSMLKHLPFSSAERKRGKRI